MKTLCLNFINSILDKYDSMVAQVLTILAYNIFSPDDAVTGSMYTLALNVKAVVTPISLTIIVIIFWIEFLKTTVKMNILKMEYAMSIVFKFILAKVVADLASTLMDAIYSTASEWITNIGDAQSSLGSTAGVLIKNAIQDYGTLECLGLMISGAVMFVIIIMCAIIMNVIAYARIFEVLMYVAISPLPCAFLPQEHSRITAKFFLNFAGVCLQGVFMAMAIKMYVALCTGIFVDLASETNVWNIIYNLVLGSIVCLMAVTKSSQWANKVFEGL